MSRRGHVELFKVLWHVGESWEASWHVSRTQAIKAKSDIDQEYGGTAEYIEAKIYPYEIPITKVELARWLTVHCGENG